MSKGLGEFNLFGLGAYMKISTKNNVDNMFYARRMIWLMSVFSLLFSASLWAFDQDGDGLADIDEINTFLTSPTLYDTDGDSLSDGYEVSNGFDPLLPNYLVAVGDTHSCVVDDNGLQCWGANLSGQINVPALLTNPTFVSAGGAHTCAINDNTAIFCWGDPASPAVANAPVSVVNPTFLVAGDAHNCVIDDNGVACWGDNTKGALDVPTGLENPIWLAAGQNFSCVIDAKISGNDVICWGNPKPDKGQTSPPTLVNPVTVSAGDIHACAIDDTGIVCWGDSKDGKTTAPATIVSPEWVDVGRSHTCAVGDGLVTCWGKANKGQLDAPLLSNPTQILSGLNHNCALHDKGIACWGDDTAGQSLVPPTLFFDPDGDGVSSQVDAFPFDSTASADTDSDGMPDSYEDANGLDKNTYDADADLDNDNLSNYTEYLNGTDPNAVEMSVIDEDLSIKPKFYRFGVETLNDANCQQNSTPVTYTITNNSLESISLGSLFVSSALSGFASEFQIISSQDVCSTSVIATASSCTFTMVYCPSGNANELGSSAGAMVQVASSSSNSAIIEAAMATHEGSRQQAQRRLPPVVSAFTIKDAAQNLVTDAQLTEGETYTIDYTASGYHSSYSIVAVWFDCSLAQPDKCGLSFDHLLSHTGFKTPDSQVDGSWGYGAITITDFGYSFSFTAPLVDQDSELVLRFYQKSQEDIVAGDTSLSLMLPGNLPLNYADTSGRRASLMIKNSN